MVQDELKSLVKFDPDEVRRAIQNREKEAERLLQQRNEVLELVSLYRQLLRTHGFEDPDQIPTGQAQKVTIPRVGSDRRFRNMKIADAVAIVLSDNGGRLHAQKILKGVEMGGLKVGGKYPMSTLITAMRRDHRIEKDTREKNTWRLIVGASSGLQAVS